MEHRKVGLGFGGGGGAAGRHSEAAVKAAKLALDKAIFGGGDSSPGLPDWLPMPKDHALSDKYRQNGGNVDEDDRSSPLPPLNLPPPLTSALAAGSDYNGNAAVAAAAAAALDPERLLAMQRNIQTNSELLRQFQAATAAAAVASRNVAPGGGNGVPSLGLPPFPKLLKAEDEDKEAEKPQKDVEGVSPPTSPAVEAEADASTEATPTNEGNCCSKRGLFRSYL